MAKIIASLVDGRVIPWFAEADPVPQQFVVVPDALLAKYESGEITDGRALAKLALAGDGAEVGTARPNVHVAPPRAKAKGGDPDPGAVDPAEIPQGEPGSASVTHFPRAKGAARA